MKLKITLLLFFFSFLVHSQIKGVVKDVDGKTLPFVNIFEEDTYNSTTSNDQGRFELSLKTPGKHTILFQYLGYKTAKRVVDISNVPVEIEVVLLEENISLNEVIVDRGINPADEIIRNAIKNKKANTEKSARYTADFYSRGIFRVKNLPKKILGQKLDFFDEIIDSTRSGILYLSETVSTVTFQKPD